MSGEISSELIQEASNRIRGIANETPCYKSFSEDDMWLKLECFQPVRSFKIRGASNKILSIPEEDRKKHGLITASSGNHGLAVSYVGHLLGINATVVVPENVNPEKLSMIKSLGARAILFGTQQDQRAERADEISKKEGQIPIPPFNDPLVIAGQATCGLEISNQVPEMDCVFVPIGGGGLISGIASFLKQNEKTKHVKIIGVQPEGSPSMYKSWKARELTSIANSSTIADGLSVRRPGDLTFSLVMRYVDDIVLVSDEEIMYATATLLSKEHVLVEPSGAASFAAARRFHQPGKQDNKTVAVISGGNISMEILRKVLAHQR